MYFGKTEKHLHVLSFSKSETRWVAESSLRVWRTVTHFFIYTVRCHYNAVDFLQNLHKDTP